MDLNKSNESSFLNSPTARTIVRLTLECFIEEQRHLFKAIYAESDLIDPSVFAASTDTPKTCLPLLLFATIRLYLLKNDPSEHELIVLSQLLFCHFVIV